MSKKPFPSRIGIAGGSTTARVFWAYNYLNQRRQFAFDGVVWYYQPNTTEPFQVVSANDLPQNVKNVVEGWE